LKNKRLRKVIIISLFSFVLLIPTATFLTGYLYEIYEKKQISIAQSLIFVMQTITTTGYGELLPFSSSVMNIYAIILMLIGLSLIFLVLATAATQWLHEHFEEIPPAQIRRNIQGHVILCGYNPLTESIIDEVAHHHIPYLILEKNIDSVRELMIRDIPVIHGDPLEHDALINAGIRKASAMIISGGSEQNVKIVLEARALTDSPLYAVVDDIKHEETMRIAGATGVIFPKHLLGEELARWALSIFNASFLSKIDDTDNLVMMEFPIGLHCRFAGQTIQESGIKEKTGVTVIGSWRDGFFEPVTGPGTILTRESIVVVIGTEKQLDDISALMHGKPRKINNKEMFIVAGFGEAAKKTVRILEENDKKYRVIVRDDSSDLKFSNGDITSKESLVRSGIMDATAYLVSVDHDDDAILSVLTARHLNPDLRIIARANNHQNITKLYRAGADYVLSFSKVGAKMIANMLIGKHKMDIPGLNIQFIDQPAGHVLSGKSIAASGIFTKTGCLIAAVKKGSEILPNPPSDTVLHEKDILILLGSRDNIQTYMKLFAGQ